MNASGSVLSKKSAFTMVHKITNDENIGQGAEKNGTIKTKDVVYIKY